MSPTANIFLLMVKRLSLLHIHWSQRFRMSTDDLAARHSGNSQISSKAGARPPLNILPIAFKARSRKLVEHFEQIV